jgi:hypothetical protein
MILTSEPFKARSTIGLKIRSGKMKKGNKLSRHVGVVALSIAVALIESSAILAQNAERGANQTGAVEVRGRVYLNGYEVRTGATVTDRSLLRTECDGSAIVVVGRSRMEIGPGTEAVLKIEPGLIGAELRAGRVAVRPAAGVKSVVMFAGGRVEAADSEPVTLIVEYGTGTTLISASGGRAKVTTTEGQVFSLAAGEVIRLNNSATVPTCPLGAMAAQGPGGTQAPSGGVQPLPPPSPLPRGFIPAMLFLGAVSATGATVAAVRAGNTVIVSNPVP